MFYVYLSWLRKRICEIVHVYFLVVWEIMLVRIVRYIKLEVVGIDPRLVEVISVSVITI